MDVPFKLCGISFTGSRKQTNTLNMHKNAQSNTNTQTYTLYLYAVSCVPPSPLGRFLLFFTLWSRSEYEFIWSNDQKIKSIESSMCLGNNVSMCKIQGQEKLKEIAGYFDPPQKHCLIASLSVAQRFAMSFNTIDVAFYDWPYPEPKPLPAHFSQAVCQPVLERLLSLYLHRI